MAKPAIFGTITTIEGKRARSSMSGEEYQKHLKELISKDSKVAMTREESMEEVKEPTAKTESLTAKAEGLTAFDKEVFGPVMIIQMSRIYDVLMSLLASQNPELASSLHALHESGRTLSPAPAFRSDS